MVRVLLVIDDFATLKMVETCFRKVGIDTQSISNELQLQEQLLVFRPEIVLACGKSSRVSCVSVGKKLKENHKFSGKSFLIFPAGFKPDPKELLSIKVDAAIESPIVLEKLLSKICKLGNMPVDAILEKFEKAKLSDPELLASIKDSHSVVGIDEDDDIHVGTLPNKKSLQAKKRDYSKFTENLKIDVKASSHNKDKIKEIQKNLKKDWDFKELEEIDKLKQEFVQALFKKK